MKVSNNHVRQSEPNINITINGTKYSIYPQSWKVSKSQLRYIANKAKNGKITIPESIEIYYTIHTLYATEDNQLSTVEA